VTTTSKHVILGTAGHIDHGKTALVKALTGIDTDRLPEEKARGISIELGFARFDLPSGVALGVVDVPGHEKFVRTMLAGVAGIDLVLLVVAADEGVMPQTREHLDIVNLLGVSSGLVALTKTDLVPPEQIELVREEVEDLLAGTTLEGAPVVPVSSVTRAGLTDLVGVIEQLVARVEERSPGGPARLPVDRVFTLAGHGTVVTGTLWSGSIAVGDKVEIYPRGVAARVRSVQVHDRPVESALAGQRTAVGLAGLPRDDVARGETVGTPGALHVTHMLDARLRVVPDAKPVSNRTRVHFHLGTTEVLGRIVLLEDETLAPGREALVQMRLEAPVVAETGDLFVVRSYSPVHTIGGGRVIDPAPSRHKRMKDDVLESLTVLESGRPEDVVHQMLEQAGIEGLPEAALLASDAAAYADASRALLADGRVEKMAGRLLTAGRRRELEARVHELLQSFARGAPLEWGMSAEELRGKLSKGLDRGLLDAVLTDLERQGKASRRGNLVRLGGADVGLSGDQAKLAQAIEARLLAAGANPPSLEELNQELRSKDLPAIVKLLAETGRIVKVTSTMFFHPKIIDGIREKVVRHFESKSALGVPEFKDLVGVTRKYAIPLLEFFDREGTTLRSGDVRVKGRRGR
jgi:selenocysteine-specific elongation factor